MWVLEGDGDVLGGRRIWLRPGRSYLFGRTKSEIKPDEQFIKIENKSVSRKHLTIAVGHVQPGSAGNAYSRSKVTLIDDSKIGTTLNGVKFSKASKTLDKSDEHKIQLGSYAQVLRITWKKVGFTFSYTTKQVERDDILSSFRRKLEPLDMKVYADFIADETTFLVSGKRNIPKGLQALIRGKPIVKEDYVDEVAACATSPGVGDDGTYISSKLEEDIDQNWPAVLAHIPEPGTEPVRRPAETLLPNFERISVFEGLTFIFGDEAQYSTLMPAIMSGGAKCLLHPIKVHETTVSEYVDYVRSVGNKKKGAPTRDVEHDRDVILVRISRKGNDDDKDWIVHFIRDVEVEFGQESIEQNEFLDAILQNDARQLVKPVVSPGEDERREEHRARPPPRARTQPQVDTEPPPSTEPITLRDKESSHSDMADPPRKARRVVARSRFKGFDDFDASQIPKAEMPAAEMDVEAVTNASNTRTRSQVSESQSLFVSDEPSVAQRPLDTGKSSLKRTREGTEHDPNSIIDALVPTANALKKRRINQPNDDLHMSEEPEHRPLRNRSNQRVEREIDVLSHAQNHAKELDAKSRNATLKQRDVPKSRPGPKNLRHLDEMADQNEDEIGPEEMRRLQALTIEEFDLPDLSTYGNADDRRDAQRGERWQAEWNGRKNFKGFKRARDRNGQTGSRTVMPQTFIAMVDAKVKDYGVREAFLDDEEGQDEEGLASRRRTAEEEDNDEDNGLMDSDVEVIVSQSQNRSGQSRSTNGGQQSTASSRRGKDATARVPSSFGSNSAARGSKRQPPSSGETAPPPKKTRQTRTQSSKQAAEESDEDEMRFRRKRR